MIRILSIGNSFSQDSHAWLAAMAAQSGIDIMAVNMYIAGCSLKRHWDSFLSGSADYDYEVNGENKGKFSFLDALKSEKWDIVTFHQASTQSGRPFTYVPFLTDLQKLVLKYQPQAKIYIFETWAFETDSEHPSFGEYNNSQREMYIRLKDCYKMACRLTGDPMIPVGEVIQYLRDNTKEFDYRNGGISLNRDGFHLSELYGRYAAALTWFCLLFNVSADTVSFVPELSGEKTDTHLLEVVKHAVSHILNLPAEVDND